MYQRRYRFTPDPRYPVALRYVGLAVLRLHPEAEQRLIADAARRGNTPLQIYRPKFRSRRECGGVTGVICG